MDSNELKKDDILKAFKGKCTIDNSIPDLRNDPTALKALAEANEFIRKHGLPKELGPLVNVKTGQEWHKPF